VRAAIYERLMEAQEEIAHALYRRGVGDATVVAALDAADERLTSDERREDLYLSALRHYVAALGGTLEIRAVFDDDVAIALRPPRGEG
jgi:hypothetical protein